MKKTLLVVLALVMSLATLLSTVSLVSAEDSAADIKYMDATLNEVKVDAEFTTTQGKGLVTAEDGMTITANSVAPTTEFILDTALENAYVGAAWSQTEGMVYFGINALASIEYVTIEIGGKTAELDVSMTSSVTGIADATCAKNADDTIIEIALPIEGLKLENNGRYLWTELVLSITADGVDDMFEGGLQFTDYSANFALNPVQTVFAPVMSGDIAPTLGSDNTITFLDNSTKANRSAAIIWAHGAVQYSKNMSVEFDLNIKEMPYAQVFGGGPGMWGEECADAHIWACVRNRYNEQLYFNFINHVDDGIVLLIQEQLGAPQSFTAGYKVPAEPQVVKLGKEAGEKFTFKYEWNENYHGIISVDGKVIYETDHTNSDSPLVGKTTGILLFNTQRTTPLDPEAKIEVELSNISINQLVDEYDIEALAALAGSDVDTTPSDPSNPSDPSDPSDPEDPTDKNDGGDDNDTDAPATTDDKKDDAADKEEKGGCGGSLAGMSVAMIAGTALVTAIGSSKKRRK